VAIFVCVCLGQEWIDSLVWFLVNHPVNILTLVYICESCAMSGTGQLCLNNVEIIFFVPGNYKYSFKLNPFDI